MEVQTSSLADSLVHYTNNSAVYLMKHPVLECQVSVHHVPLRTWLHHLTLPGFLTVVLTGVLLTWKLIILSPMNLTTICTVF